jgi:hypothetical protein
LRRRRRRRRRRLYYSGKKKKHTVKNLYMVNQKGLIVYKTGQDKTRQDLALSDG